MAPVTLRLTRTCAALVLLACLVTSCGGSDEPTGRAEVPVTATTSDLSGSTGVAQLDVEVVDTHPHDTDAYTQGLVYAGPDRLYETTGRYGQSSLRETEITTGSVLRNQPFDDTQFGEGLALADGRLIALTWREHTAIAFEPSSFEQLATFDYDTEGWGLCDDGARLVMSDGSSTLTFRDQTTFEPLGSITVTLEGNPLDELNELECVDGMVYANVYLTDRIVVIDPSTGAVTAEIDASGLLPVEQEAALDRGEVLNGIAYDTDRDVFYLTGKDWPSLFEVRFVPAG